MPFVRQSDCTLECDISVNEIFTPLSQSITSTDRIVMTLWVIPVTIV